MNTRQFAELRKKSGMTQSVVAQALGLTPRTIANWEAAAPPRELSLLEGSGVHQLFLPELLGRRIPDMCDQAFEAIASEMAALWLTQHGECILLPFATRYHDMKKNMRKDVPAATCISPLVLESLTTYPLRTAETLNLAGDAIARHRAKKYKGTREAPFFASGTCESLLHVPAFTASAHGPHPVLLLSLENKLDKQGRVIMPKEGQTTIYTEEDESTAKMLAEEFRDRLLTDMALLDMIP